MDSVKKRREKRQFQVFCKLYDAFPEGTIEDDRERPDFRVTTPTGVTIGIDLMDVYLAKGPRTQQAQECLRPRIADLAQKKWGESQGISVHVSVHFNPIYEIKKTEVEAIATNIVGIVKRIMPQTEGIAEESYGWLSRHYFPEAIHTISVLRSHDAPGTSFGAPYAEYIPRLMPDEVQRKLDHKRRKYDDYRAQCHSVWLVMNTDITPERLSSSFSIPDYTRRFEYITPFDKVFLLKHDTPELIELTVRSLSG